MYKMLLSDNRPIIIDRLVEIINEAVENAEVHLVGALAEINDMLKANDYQMMILCLPRSEPVPVLRIKEMVENTKSSIVIVLSEEVNKLLLREMYQAGVHGILGRHSDNDEIKKALMHVRNGNVYINFDFE